MLNSASRQKYSNKYYFVKTNSKSRFQRFEYSCINEQKMSKTIYLWFRHETTLQKEQAKKDKVISKYYLNYKNFGVNFIWS